MDSSNLNTEATTQTHEFIISWHRIKNPNPKITILAPERLPKLVFVDLGTGVCLSLMFMSGVVAWFCCFLRLLSLEVDLGF